MKTELEIIRDNKKWLARRGDCEGRGATKIKAIKDLEETERFVRIANPKLIQNLPSNLRENLELNENLDQNL